MFHLRPGAKNASQGFSAVDVKLKQKLACSRNPFTRSMQRNPVSFRLDCARVENDSRVVTYYF